MFQQIDQFASNVRPVLHALKADLEALRTDVHRMCQDELALGRALLAEGVSRFRITIAAAALIVFFSLAALVLVVVAGVALLKELFPLMSWAVVFGVAALVCTGAACIGTWVALHQWNRISELRLRSARLFQ